MPRSVSRRTAAAAGRQRPDPIARRAAPAPAPAPMNVREAAAFVRRCGVVLVSARGPVPTLVEAILRAPVRGSWWAHPQGRHVYRVLQAVSDSPSVLVCRAVGDKLTLVHVRLWPALVRIADTLPRRRLAKVRQVHTPAGHHLNQETPFPDWVPAAARRRAAALSADAARAALGQWSGAPA